MSSRDADERIAAHYAGKQYVGWKIVREKLIELQKKVGRGGGGPSAMMGYRGGPGDWGPPPPHYAPPPYGMQPGYGRGGRDRNRSRDRDRNRDRDRERSRDRDRDREDRKRERDRGRRDGRRDGNGSRGNYDSAHRGGRDYDRHGRDHRRR